VRHVALVELEQHVFLGGEVEVHRALGEARLVGDLGHVGHPVGLLEVELLDRVEQLLLALFLVLYREGTLYGGHN